MTKKDTGIAYICWFFGLHYLYLGRPATWILFVLSLFVFVGVIWWIIDLFRIPSLVKDYNDLAELAERRHGKSSS